jgi:hypothetical protein
MAADALDALLQKSIQLALEISGAVEVPAHT